MTLGPALPRNWYLLGATACLRRGEIISREIGGLSIVAYRGEDDGQPVVFDAHCVHMGCHLGRGKVVRDGLRCGLHHRVIGPDGHFVGVAREGPRQATYPVREYLGGLFVFLGTAGERTQLAALELEGNACCYAGEHYFPLPWQSLVANGLDVEHLSAVHDRALQVPPTIDRRSARELQLQYLTRPSANRLSDRVMNWLAKDGIHGSIRCFSGTMMLVESRIGARQTFILMSFCPDGIGGTRIRGLVGVKGQPDLRNRLFARIARALFKSFLYKDLDVLEGLRWHEPSECQSLGDRMMREVCDFFRSLPSA